MKTKLTLIILAIAASIAVSIYAGNYQFGTDPADDPRILEAYGSILGYKDANGNPRPATQREVSAACMNWVFGSTSDYERRKNMAAFSPPPSLTLSPTPSPTPGLAVQGAKETPKK